MATPTFVTQATNFTNALAGGVDPRTGLYTVTLHLGQSTGNRGAGPALPIILQYSPLNRSDVGLGIGWTLGLSTMAQLGGPSPILCVSTGEQYGLHLNADGYVPWQQQLKSFHLIKEDASHYWINHKSGDREYLEIQGDVAYVSKLYTEAGHKLVLSWDASQGAPRLTRVVDDDGNKLFDVPNGYGPSGVSFSFLSFSNRAGHGEMYSVDLTLQESMLQSVTIQAPNCDAQAWTFKSAYVDSKHAWGQWILGILKGPGGYSDLADYSQQHLMPSGAPVEFMPCVGTYTRNPGGGQQPLVSNYEYSDKNFLGGGAANIKWYADRDSLMELPFDDDYIYSSTETQRTSVGSSPNIATKRTYNAYHLLKQIDVSSDGNTRTTLSEYNGIKIGATIDNQKSWYQFPTAKINTWNGTNPEKSNFTWDDFGNSLTREDPDGLKTQWSYYSEAGEGENCPPEPNGFRRYVKWMLIDPTKVKAANWITGTAPVNKTIHKYAVAQAVTGSKKTLVLKSYDQLASATSTDNYGNLINPITLSEATYTYWSGSQSAQYKCGRLTQRTITHHSNNSSNKSYNKTDNYSYQYIDETDLNFPYGLQTKHTLTVTGADGNTLTTTDTHVKSTFTGRIWQETDIQNNVTSYQYDGLGRYTRRTMDPNNSDYTNVLTYTYEIDNTGVTPFLETQKDLRGNRIRYASDGMRRSYKKEVNNIDSDGIDSTQFYTLSTKQFDGAGQLWQSTASDVAFDATRSRYSVIRTHTYDGWGHLKKTISSDGEVNNIVYDPLTKTVKTWLSSTRDETVTGASMIYFDYNFSQKTYRSERYTAGKTSAPYSTRSKAYDGLHRVRSDTDEQSRTTTYDYDDWHRISQSTMPDGTIVVRTYSPDSPEKRVTNIQVTKAPGNFKTLVSPGTRQFDGLGRVTQTHLGEITGNRCWSYDYDNDSYTRPTSATDPDGTKRDYTYSYQLGESVETVKTHGRTPIEQRFGYYTAPGLLKHAVVVGGDNWIYKPYPSGRLMTEQLNGETGLSMQYTYTASGAPHSYTHVDNATQMITRDSYGRISNISDGIITVTPSYNGANQLNGWTATQGKHTLTTDFGGYLLDGGKASDYLDDFGRETKRVIHDSLTKNTWVISQTWQKNDLLSQRIIKRNGIEIEAEIFGYDARNRLSSWDGIAIDKQSGIATLPRDQYGNTLIKQLFFMDSLNNITQVSTKFLDGSSNLAKFTFSDQDPCLLTGGTNTHPSYPKSFTVNNDKSGRILSIVNDDTKINELTFAYDDLGRVKAASCALTGQSGTYSYDAHNRLASQSIEGQSDTIGFYYRSNQLVNLVQSGSQVRLFQSPVGSPTAQINTGGDNEGFWLLGTNSLGSVINTCDGITTDETSYSAYGEEEITKSKN